MKEICDMYPEPVSDRVIDVDDSVMFECVESRSKDLEDTPFYQAFKNEEFRHHHIWKKKIDWNFELFLFLFCLCVH